MLSYTYERYWRTALLIICYSEELNCDPLVQPWLQNSQVYLGQRAPCTKSEASVTWHPATTTLCFPPGLSAGK